MTIIKSAIYGYHGGTKFCHICQTNVDCYMEPHILDSILSYFITISYISNDNNRVINQISKIIPDVYPIIDNRLKAIHNEFNNEVSNLIALLINRVTESNYNLLKDSVYKYLDKVIKCETPVTNQLKLLGKQINSPRIVIINPINQIILDTYETADNTLNNYYTKTIYDSQKFIEKMFIENVFVILYGKYGGIKYNYIDKQNENYYIESHKIASSLEPAYSIKISCLSDENIMINNNFDKLELIENDEYIDNRLKLIQEELVMEINEPLNIFMNDRNEISYNNLKDILYNYFYRATRHETPITEKFKVKYPVIIIFDCDFTIMFHTNNQVDNTFYNYINGKMTYDNISNHHLYPTDIMTAFFGNYGAVGYYPSYRSNANFYTQAYGPNLSQATHYISTYCLNDGIII